MSLNRYYLSLPLLLAALFLWPHAAQAQRLADASGSAATGPYAEVSHGPQILRNRGDEITLTHSESQEIVDQTGIACADKGDTTENSYWRVFDLAEFGLTAPLTVTSVDIGIESTSDWVLDVESNVRLYTLDGEFVETNLTLVAEATYEITDDDDLVLVNVPIVGAKLATDAVLVVEWNVPNLLDDGAGVFFGANTAGQTGATYVSAVVCGLTDPTDLAEIGFPDVAWVLNINGTTMATASEDGAVAQRVTLGQAYPNPVVDRAAIPFALERAQHVRVALYDALGREVAVAADRAFGAGEQSVAASVNGLPNGIYFYRISAGDLVLTRKMVVLQ